MNHQATQERIVKDIAIAVETNQCPKCKTPLKFSGIPSLASCEMACPSCSWAIAFGPHQVDEKKSDSCCDTIH